MSVEDIPAVRSINQRLRDLLAKARSIKQSATIDPPLPATDFESDVLDIAQLPRDGPDDGIVQPSPSAQPQHAALETAARTIFYEQLAACEADDGAFTEICNLLDILQFCADYQQCDASLPLWLVEELLDSQTIDGCKRVFDFLESRRERMINDTFQKGKQLIVLRSCNELLRRLSRAEDAVFCGRVFMFLFQSFPLGDKSSVNLRGEFHVENTTVFDRSEPKSNVGEEEESDNMQVDGQGNDEYTSVPNGDSVPASIEQAAPAKEVEDASKPINNDSGIRAEGKELDVDALYSVFWSLQHVFSNPTKTFVTEEFESFKKGLEATIRKFRSVPKVLQTRGTPRAPGESSRGTKRKRSSDHDEFASNFNPKYLTSRDLFELEMSDLTFQRHVLVQALILMDFLLSLTPKAKKKLVELKAQKAMLYPYTLSPEDTAWATTMRATIASYLQEGPEGKFYYRMVDNVLSRDKNWVRWKVESCPPISLPALPTTIYMEAIAGARRACAPKRLRGAPLGSMDLGFLSEDGGAASKELERLRDPARYTPPGMENYLKEVGAVDLDLEIAGEEERRELQEKRASLTWRMLRLVAKKRLSMFDEIDETKSLDVLGRAEAVGVPDGEAGRDEVGEATGVEGPVGTVPEVKVEGVDGEVDTVMTVEEVQTPALKEADEPATEADAETKASLPISTTTPPPANADSMTAPSTDQPEDTPAPEPDPRSTAAVDTNTQDAAGADKSTTAER